MFSCWCLVRFFYLFILCLFVYFYATGRDGRDYQHASSTMRNLDRSENTITKGSVQTHTFTGNTHWAGMSKLTAF